MATTQEILKAATDLGKLVATHESAQRLEKAVKRLEADLESQRLLNDFNRLLQNLGQKEAAGQPIEVPEKRKLQELQQQIAHSLTLREFQTAQMDYVDLLRKIDEQISGGPAESAAPAGLTPPVGPVPGSSRLV